MSRRREDLRRSLEAAIVRVGGEVLVQRSLEDLQRMRRGQGELELGEARLHRAPRHDVSSTPERP